MKGYSSNPIRVKRYSFDCQLTFLNGENFLFDKSYLNLSVTTHDIDSDCHQRTDDDQNGEDVD